MYITVVDWLVPKITVKGFLTCSYPTYNDDHVIRSDIKNFVIKNNLPFGVMADKMTSKHLTRHMVGIRLPIWDVRTSYLTKDLYLQCSPINDVTGLGLTNHVVGTL